MPILSRSQLLRLTAIILLGSLILLPAFVGRAPAFTDDQTGPAARTATLATIAPRPL